MNSKSGWALVALISLTISWAAINGSVASEEIDGDWHPPIVDSLGGLHLVVQWRENPATSRVQVVDGGGLVREWEVPAFAIKNVRFLEGALLQASGNLDSAWGVRLYRIQGQSLSLVWSSESLPDELTGYEIGGGELGVSDDGVYWFSVSSGPPLRVEVGEIRSQGKAWSWVAEQGSVFDAPDLDVGRVLVVTRGRPPVVAIQLGADVVLVDVDAGAAATLQRPPDCQSIGNITKTRGALWTYCFAASGARSWLAYDARFSEPVRVSAPDAGVSEVGSELFASRDGKALIVDNLGGRVVELAVDAVGRARAVRSGRFSLNPGGYRVASGILWLDPNRRGATLEPWEQLLAEGDG